MRYEHQLVGLKYSNRLQINDMHRQHRHVPNYEELSDSHDDTLFPLTKSEA